MNARHGIRTLLVGIGCLFGTLLILGIAWVVFASYSFRECNGSPFMVASGADQMVTLSPDRPLAEQRLVVHLAAESLPSDAQPDDAVLELVRVVADPGASAPDVDLTFIDDDTGAVVARVASVDNADGGVSYLPASIRLGCAVGEACDRAFRVVLSLPSNEIDGPVDVGWSVRAKVSSVHWAGCTSPPFEARPTIQGEPAVVHDADSLGQATLAPRAEAGTIVARHLTVATPRADGVTVARLRLQREVESWRSWIRVIADDASVPILDEPLGQAFQPIADAIVEVPVLTDCQAEAPCERGYWVVMQSFESAPDYFDPRWTATPGMGRYSWTATAQTLADPDDPAAAAPELRVDDGPADLAPVPAVETQAVTVPLTPNVDRIIDATISIPERPSVSGGLDPLEAALAVVHWTGFGMSVASHLEGPGTDAQSGGASAGGSANLIAHPFAACPPSGPCEVTLRLVSRLTPDERTRISGDPVSTWKLSLVGVPASTTVAFSEPIDRELADSPSSVPWPLLVAIVLGGLVALVLARRARIRR